jgi:hypothetical protein
MGGGSTVKIDLAFSPLEATIQARVDVWKEQELIDARFYTQENIAAAYQWVREKTETRQLSQHELNQDNKVLWDRAEHLGSIPSCITSTAIAWAIRRLLLMTNVMLPSN